MLGDFINAVADGLFEKGFGDEGEEVYWDCNGTLVDWFTQISYRVIFRKRLTHFAFLAFHGLIPSVQKCKQVCHYSCTV